MYAKLVIVASFAEFKKGRDRKHGRLQEAFSLCFIGSLTVADVDRSGSLDIGP